MSDAPRSPSPSRFGKRRIIRHQDSASEPPRKSPASSPSAILPRDQSQFDFDFVGSTQNDLSPIASPCGSWSRGSSCDSHVGDEASPPLTGQLILRPVKRAVRHRSVSPKHRGVLSSPSGTSEDNTSPVQGPSSQNWNLHFGNKQRHYDDTTSSVDESEDGGSRPRPPAFLPRLRDLSMSSVDSGHSTPASSTHSSPSRCRSPGTFYRMRGVNRRNSKDVLDEYFSMKRGRRRSSCKEITLQILRRESVSMDPNKPLFRTVETRRRLSFGQSVAEEMPSAEHSPIPSPIPGSPVEEDIEEEKKADLFSDSELFSVPTVLTRSRSMDGFDAIEAKEKQAETQALLFDSMPDLTDEDNYRRLPDIRKNRRGAVCYDMDNALMLLQELNLEETED